MDMIEQNNLDPQEEAEVAQSETVAAAPGDELEADAPEDDESDAE